MQPDLIITEYNDFDQGGKRIMGNKNMSAKIIDQKSRNNDHKTYHVSAKQAVNKVEIEFMLFRIYERT